MKFAVQGHSNQVEKTQLEYAMRSPLRAIGSRINLIMVIQNLQTRFRLPLTLMGIDDVRYFSKCDWAAVGGLKAHHNELNISGYEVKELTADATC